uniref:Uncharacterized protein n=1 Tax=Echinostoma caproni TaxID=27848 RepID=A0A183B7Y7_9TREM
LLVVWTRHFNSKSIDFFAPIGVRFTVKNFTRRGNTFGIRSNGFTKSTTAINTCQPTFTKLFRRLGTVHKPSRSENNISLSHFPVKRSQSVLDTGMTSCAERRACDLSALETEAHESRVGRNTRFAMKHLRQVSASRKSRATIGPPDRIESVESGQSEFHLENHANEHIWSNLWHSGMPDRSWQIWGNCGWNETFAKDLPPLHLFNDLNGSGSQMKLTGCGGTSRRAESTFRPEQQLYHRDERKETKLPVEIKQQQQQSSNQSPQGATKIPSLHVKRLVLEPGRSSIIETTGRSKPGSLSNNTGYVRLDTDVGTAQYPDPRVGASSEFLARLGELLNLEETTKRCERIRWRRRVKKRTPSIGAGGDA